MYSSVDGDGDMGNYIKLPKDWCMKLDFNSGRTYYMYKPNGQVPWEFPGWRQGAFIKQ